MTALNTILNAGWDTDICTKPSFITLREANFRFYPRVVGTQIVTDEDEFIGIPDRDYYSAESHDAYIIKFCTQTSLADLRNMEQAIKKVCATYDPTSAESILEWSGGEIKDFNGWRWEFTMTIYVRKSGVSAYT